MSDPKLAKAAHRLLREVQRIAKRFTKATVLWLLRVAFVANRRGRYANAGFVLPTTAMLVLVVTLTAGALSYRAFNTSNRAIGDLQNRVIYNAATPAIDRARAKLEFMFDPAKDFRFPGGVPSEKFLTSMMLNDGSSINGAVAAPLTIGGADPYQLPDEQRLDINGDGKRDNAWAYREDTDRDGKADATIVYSVLFSTPNDTGLGTNQVPGYQKLLQLDDDAKVQGETQGDRVVSFARSGPLSNAKAKTCGSGSTGGGVEQGWYEDQGGITSTLRKNFQVDAFVIPDKVAAGAQGNFTTLEFQQDRQLDRGNKWGAWFRNDMEIFPGPQFNWNGAIHTEGSFIASGRFEAYLVSTRPSCVYSPERSSEISVTRKVGSTAADTFYGIFSTGTIRDNNLNNSSGNARVHIYSDNPQDIVNNTGGNFDIELNANNDWFSSNKPVDIALDPKKIQESDGYAARGADPTNAANRDMAKMGANNRFNRRFFANAEIAPYVDDTYRADDRYGPKQRYKGSVVIPSGSSSGDVITNSDPNYDQLVANNPLGNDATNVGLDGYWERRALNEGARIIVGQRLELGNSSGWSAPKDRPNTLQDGVLQPLDATSLRAGDGNFDTVREFDGTVLTGSALENTDPELNDDNGDPLYAPARLNANNPHENRQRRALRDNTAAVQATAVYHYASDSGKNYPIACLASTAHHGSPYALARSINFLPTIFKNTSSQDVGLIVDFFNGKGTNGWEFEPPQQNETNFASAVANTTSPLRIALDNLANFAGDPKGAFPAEQEAGKIHPDPEVTMWGDFSNLRRTLQRLDTVGYNALSPADKTNLETASCTLGMLAYNIEQVRQFDPKNPANDQGVSGVGETGRLMGALGYDLFELMDGVNDPLNGNLEVVPRQQLSTYQYGKINGIGGDPGNVDQSYYNARDYDRVPAEAFLAKLRESYERNGLRPQERRKLAMAELIFAHFQIDRDRTYGFRASPAANTWNYNPYIYFNDSLGGFQLFSSACDPNTFAFTSSTAGANETGKSSAEKVKLQLGAEQNVIRFRVGLSRLCGTVIPNGALREGPGDLHMPVRNDNTNLAKYLVTQNGSSPLNLRGATLALPEGVNAPNPNSFSTPEKKEGLAYFWEYQKYFDIQKSQGANLSSQTSDYTKEHYLRASVAPKWPSLYYIFPQVQHGLTGGLTSFASGLSGETVCIDHRQPTGALNYFDPDSCSTSGTSLRAAFQPWAEPYVTDPDVVAAVGSYVFKPVDNGGAGDPNGVSPLVYTVGDDDPNKCNFAPNGKHCYRSFNFPVTGRSVAGLVVRPRRLPAGFTNPTVLDAAAGTWQTPIFSLDSITTRQQFRPTNRIMVPNGNSFNSTQGITAVIPFLDRVMFNGREWLPARVMDIDLGMLRHEIVKPGEPWLPMSGIIYAFREDAIREDAIARSPNVAADARTDAGSTDPTAQSDPRYSNQKISYKAVDYIPDPERRVHGFRLRDGAILRRSPNTISGAGTGIEEQDNIRGLSFFSDDPVYIMGYYNLHQTGTSDSAVEDTAINTSTGGGTNRIEEFKELLPTNAAYNKTQFYTNRKTLNPDFANQTRDWWRPSEILADSITILSESFCDGSAIDTFMTTAQGSTAEITNTTFSGRNKTLSGDDLPNYLFPYALKTGSTVQGAAVYNDPLTGLYGPGCTNGGANSRTSFLNQNRPRYDGMFSQNGWSWVRESPDDNFAAVAISRNGSGRVLPHQPNPGNNAAYNTRRGKISMTSSTGGTINDDVRDITRTAVSWRKPEPVFDYDFVASRNSVSVDNLYARINGSSQPQGTRAIPPAENTRVNSITISGIGPSREGSPYGGLHNFPRFLETWSGRKLWFAGSFLQLNFSNYGTAPFDNDAWELSQSPDVSSERISYYSPPDRLWGYDVALQLAPAGPAAARFVTSSNVRNEFYNEPAANDAYIKALCESLRVNNGALNALNFSGDTNAQAAKNRIQNGQFSCPK